MMKIVRDFKRDNLPKESVCAIGNFDGVHLGHQAILKKLKKESIKLCIPSVAITFHPHPMKVLFPEKEIKLICTREQKIKEIEKFSIDYLLEIPFDLKFSKISAEDFIKNFLLERLKIKKIIIGAGFNFGYKKKGNFQMMKNFGKKYGFSVNVINPLKQKNYQISSTNIRKFLLEGKIKDANKMLGRNYSLKGKVIYGTQRGKEIGIPTINLENYNDLLLKEGIYSGFTKIKGDEKKILSAISIGKNPTFNGKNIFIEAHLIEFSKDIYGKEVEIYFFSKLREQKKFRSVKKLVENIKNDIEIVKKIKDKIIGK